MSKRRTVTSVVPLVTGRVWISIALLVISLAVLTLSPVFVSIRTRALRSEITEVAEPIIAAASGIERSVALQLAALRGFAMTGDSTYLEEYRRLDVEEEEWAERLSILGEQLDVEVGRHADRLRSLAAAWDSRVESVTTPMDRQALERLLVGSSIPTALLAEAMSLRRSVDLTQRLRRAEIANVEQLEIWTNFAMVILAAAAGISLVFVGRRLHHLMAEAEEGRERLQQSHARRARLMRGMSHDLKNPLGAADAHAEFLEMEMKGPLTRDQKVSVEAIRRSIGTTVLLVEDLLQLAKAERGELPVNPTSVEFSTLVSEVADEAKVDAESKGLTLDVEGRLSPVRGRTDPDRVREVLQNLVSNAIRCTPSGGMVSMSVSEVPEQGRRQVRAVRLCVSDTGPGIAPADQDRIFEEFERVGTDSEGSGLGLAISRHIAHLLGGEIRVESTVGKGSTFCLTLPAELEERRPGPARRGPR